jgi:hypothetical protein
MEDKSLELRIAAIEDKLSKLGVSQADILAYQKVASVASASSPALSPQLCSINCVISIPVHVHTIHTGVGPVFTQQSATQPATAAGFEDLGK